MDIVITGGRQSGKTTKAIMLSAKHHRYILVTTRARASNIADIARKMGVDIPFPVTVEELPLRSPFIKEIIVDDVEDVLSMITGKRVTAFTTSNKEVRNNPIEHNNEFYKDILTIGDGDIDGKGK